MENERKTKKSGQESVKILVGNKCDKIKHDIKPNEIIRLKNRMGGCTYLPTSALENFNVTNLFIKAANEIFENANLCPP